MPGFVDSKTFGRIMAALRKIWLYSKLRRDTLIRACTGQKYRCNGCKNLFDRPEIAVDHPEPVIPVEGFDSWDGVVRRLLAPSKMPQVLCKECHRLKTNKENKTRRAK